MNLHSIPRESEYLLMGRNHFLMGMGRSLMEMNHHSLPQKLNQLEIGMSHHSILKESSFSKGNESLSNGQELIANGKNSHSNYSLIGKCHHSVL